MTYEQLDSGLVVAVANVLQRHGLHFTDAGENEGWTAEMCTEFSLLMDKQIQQMSAAREQSAHRAKYRAMTQSNYRRQWQKKARATRWQLLDH